MRSADRRAETEASLRCGRPASFFCRRKTAMINGVLEMRNALSRVAIGVPVNS